jgi:hypothetical protein
MFQSWKNYFFKNDRCNFEFIMRSYDLICLLSGGQIEALLIPYQNTLLGFIWLVYELFGII